MLKETGSLRDTQFTAQGAISRKMVIAVILGVALIAFEIFNFDTTQYALTNLLGEVRFVGVLWASILAVACLLYTSPSPRDGLLSRMPSSA